MSNNNEELISHEGEEMPIIENPSKTKVGSILQELEVLALSKNRNNGLDLSNFSEKQTDKLLDILAKNEENAFNYHTKKLDTLKEVEIKRIDSSSINQKTLRWIAYGVVIAIPLITILLMFYKDEYFVPWLTFLAGLAGGTGINKASRALLKTPEKSSLIEEE